MVGGTDVLDAVVGAAGVSQTEVHGTTNKHVNKKLAPSIRNTDITQSLKTRETLRELAFIKRDTRDSTIQLDLDQLEIKKAREFCPNWATYKAWIG
jgi:hypothetical protein